jgi:hypothetical protein
MKFAEQLLDGKFWISPFLVKIYMEDTLKDTKFQNSEYLRSSILKLPNKNDFSLSYLKLVLEVLF